VIAQTRAELLKIRSTRTTLGLLLALVGLALLFALLTGLLGKSGDLVGKENQRLLLGNGTLAGVFAALAGIMLVTSEYRFGTIGDPRDRVARHLRPVHVPKCATISPVVSPLAASEITSSSTPDRRR
jgi:hypothetical protein